MGNCYPAWSPCGQFIAVSSESAVAVLSSIGLENVTTLEPPAGHVSGSPRTLTFSPDSRLVACVYPSLTEERVDDTW